MTTVINTLYVTDESYFIPMLVSIESVLNNLDNDTFINCFIIDVGIKSKNLEFFKQYINDKNNIRAEIVNIETSLLKDFRTKTHVSTAAFAKVYIPRLINEKKIIYLDCDLVVNANIKDLWSEFDSDIILKAVWNPFYNYDNKYLGITDDKRTFNSGVMLLNLELMRKEDSPKKLIAFLDEYNDKTKLHDQAAFNAVFKNSWNELSIDWNYQTNMILNNHKSLDIPKNIFKKYYKNPKIIHYTGNSKPWMFRCSHPYKNLYIVCYQRVFGKIKYKDVSLKAILQRIKEKLRFSYSYLMNY